MGRYDAECLRLRVDGPTATLTIARPEARNALNASVFDAFATALTSLADDRRVNVVIVRGEGERAFCAGADLDELRGLSSVRARQVLRRGQEVFRQVEDFRAPVIAAVQGWALGGGFELALACDLIVAAGSARFGLPEAGLGLIPGYGGTQRLTHAIGRKAGLRCMLLGEPIDAARAWELGLLAIPVVEDAEFETEVEKCAARLLSRGPHAVSLIREAVRAADPIGDGLGHETALAALATGSAEAEEGVTAFLEKRPPRFPAAGD